jgi:hypothetical protein
MTDETLNVLLFKIELRLIEEFAAKAGVTPQAYVRTVLNDHIRGRVGLPTSQDLGKDA